MSLIPSGPIPPRLLSGLFFHTSPWHSGGLWPERLPFTMTPFPSSLFLVPPLPIHTCPLGLTCPMGMNRMHKAAL